MSNKGNAFISILVLLLGAVFIYFFDGDEIPRSIVFLCGLAFALPALILLIATFFTGKNRHSAGYRGIQMVCGVGGLGLGACIMLLPDIFRPLLIYPFAVLMLAGGAFQVFLISHKRRPVDYPAWMYVIPIVVMIAGVVMLCVTSLRDVENERWVVLITGVAAVLYGFNGIMVSVQAHRLEPLHPSAAGEVASGEHKSIAEGGSGVEDVSATEVVKPDESEGDKKDA
ncbi:MAG: hypothetical protein HDS68_03795 [Bacteroidales bacterium]|nr:hypothetical protein [Bacteroidales bacterium]